MYFKRVDVVAAIIEIDKILNTNHSTIVNDVKAKKVKVIDLKSKQSIDKDFINLLTSNLGLYLLIKGKVAVYSSARRIQKIVQDQAPDEVDLQGNVTETIFFSEENSDKQLFLGSMSKKLHK